MVGSLERPCLEHLHGDPTKPDEPTGHVLTSTAQVQFSSYPPSFRPQKPSPRSYSDTPPDSLLDRLRELAPDVCFEGETTPIQAWDYVRRQPCFGGLDMQTLQKLAGRLRDVVKCHGFVT